jgi:ribosomal protein L31E
MIRVLVSSWLRAERATAYMKHHINKPFAMEIIIIMSWCIWNERNGWLFNNEDPSV